jgi:putative oxidoreductase
MLTATATHCAFAHETEAEMIDSRTAPYAALLLRVALGAMFLAHSVVLKLMTFSLAGTAQFFESLGLPAPLAYLTFAAEAIGGVLLIVGFMPRLVALALIPILIGASWVHIGNGWVFSAPNGGWEYPVFLIVASVVLALVGDGAHAMRPSLARARGTVARAA